MKEGGQRERRGSVMTDVDDDKTRGNAVQSQNRLLNSGGVTVSSLVIGI